jgi:hypothetical protein
MAKETKIGLVVVFALAVTFCVVLVRRIQGTSENATRVANAAKDSDTDTPLSSLRGEAGRGEPSTDKSPHPDPLPKREEASPDQPIYQVAQISAVEQEPVDYEQTQIAAPPEQIRLTISDSPIQNASQSQSIQQSQRPQSIEDLDRLSQSQSAQQTSQQPVYDQSIPTRRSVPSLPSTAHAQSGYEQHYQRQQNALPIQQRPTIPTAQLQLPYQQQGLPAIGVSHHPGGTYVVKPNDNFWTISQAVYGTGDFFKALIRHNDSRHPRPERLAVGDEVLAPSESELRSKYPDLCPKSRKRGYSNIAASATGRGGRTYEVQEGDTLFDIARYELGQASRWIDIYQLNQHQLTDDFNFIKPGMKLNLPGREPAPTVQQERFTRQQELAPLR